MYHIRIKCFPVIKITLLGNFQIDILRYIDLLQYDVLFLINNVVTCNAQGRIMA